MSSASFSLIAFQPLYCFPWMCSCSLASPSAEHIRTPLTGQTECTLSGYLLRCRSSRIRFKTRIFLVADSQASTSTASAASSALSLSSLRSSAHLSTLALSSSVSGVGAFSFSILSVPRWILLSLSWTSLSSKTIRSCSYPYPSFSR